jgi:hypothetical protein
MSQMADRETDAAPIAEPVPDASPAPSKPGKKQYQRIDPPSMEAMMQEEFMNNCATRTVLSGVMGLGLGVLFGVFMGSMDGAVWLSPAIYLSCFTHRVERWPHDG